MTMSINGRMVNEGADVYYTPEWHRFIESHLHWLRKLASNVVLNIEPSDAYKYEADLQGLLQAYNIPMEYHFIVMRMNDMTSPTHYAMSTTQLILPDFQQIESLRSVFATTNKKIN